MIHDFNASKVQIQTKQFKIYLNKSKMNKQLVFLCVSFNIQRQHTSLIQATFYTLKADILIKKPYPFCIWISLLKISNIKVKLFEYNVYSFKNIILNAVS